MSFTPETGLVVPGANSYATVAYADAYFEDRDPAWAALTVPEKQRALVRATDYLEQRYVLRWRGTRVEPLHTLSWPRRGAFLEGDPVRPVPDDSVPSALIAATCELALRSHQAALTPDTEAARTVVTKEKVGSLEVQYEVFGSSSEPQYPAVLRTLRPLLLPSAGTEIVRS